MDRLTSFSPVTGERPRVLILGTMPSAISFEKAQYYGNPRNAFWPIQFHLAQIDAVEDYEARCRMICERGIALWDVLAHCQRTGSSDTAIRKPEPNDIGQFLNSYPTVQAIALNGASAQKLFIRYILPTLVWKGAILSLPSTSPANTMPFFEKLQRWRAINDWLS